jgi:acylphosphatase
MKHRTWMLALGVLSLGLAGCGNSPKEGAPRAAASTGASPAAATARSAEPTAIPAAAQPGEIVARFYDALKTGSAAGISALLTDKAREEMAKSGQDIRPQASSALTYSIGATELVDRQGTGAHVKTVWSETEANGTTASTEVIWVLRKQANGWRVAGMATAIEDGQLPILFNFEDPEDMERKREYVERAGQEQPAVQQADRSVDPAANRTQMR